MSTEQKGKARTVTQLTSDSFERRLARMEARFEAIIPHLATNADISGFKWAIGFLGLAIT